MAKTLLGVDIGYDSLKLALVSGSRVKKSVIVPMPQNLMRDGRVVSAETMGELVRSTMKENGIRANAAAYVIPNELVFVRNVVMPQMTADQLAYNLPYEFNDYISDEVRDYVFDYSMVSTPEQMKAVPEDGSAPSMELLGVGVLRAVLDETREIMRKAGMRLEKAAPALCSYISLIRAQGGDRDREYCILDLGYHAVRMYMFKGDRHIVTRALEIGLSGLDTVLADAYNIDEHLAHTYLLTNYESCQSRDECVNAYNNIAVELMRAVNFYRFSNPDSTLSDVWLTGGGAVIPALRQAIADTLDMQVHDAEELVPNGASVGQCNEIVQAVGITMD